MWKGTSLGVRIIQGSSNEVHRFVVCALTVIEPATMVYGEDVLTN